MGSLRSKVIIVLISLVFFGCGHEAEQRGELKDGHCKVWDIREDSNFVSIFSGGIEKVKIPKCLNCTLNVNNNLKDFKVIEYAREVMLIDCKHDSLKRMRLGNQRLPIYTSSTEIFKDFFIYRNNSEFFVFDSNLSVLYDSWDFIAALPEKEKLGLAGFEIEYEKKVDNIVLSFTLLSDVEPFLLGVKQDTIRVELLRKTIE